MTYYKIFKKGKLFQEKTFWSPEELQDYRDEFPDRQLIEYPGDHFQVVEIKSSECEDSVKGEKTVGFRKFSDAQVLDTVRKVPLMGFGTSPIEGATVMIVHHSHISKLMSMGMEAGQTTLFSFANAT